MEASYVDKQFKRILLASSSIHNVYDLYVRFVAEYYYDICLLLQNN